MNKLVNTKFENEFNKAWEALREADKKTNIASKLYNDAAKKFDLLDEEMTEIDISGIACESKEESYKEAWVAKQEFSEIDDAASDDFHAAQKLCKAAWRKFKDYKDSVVSEEEDHEEEKSTIYDQLSFTASNVFDCE